MGNTIAFSRTQDLTSFGDVIPQITLKWNTGVNNFMVYGTGDIPVGDYDPTRLANLGIGHGAIDFRNQVRDDAICRDGCGRHNGAVTAGMFPKEQGVIGNPRFVKMLLIQINTNAPARELS